MMREVALTPIIVLEPTNTLDNEEKDRGREIKKKGGGKGGEVNVRELEGSILLAQAERKDFDLVRASGSEPRNRVFKLRPDLRDRFKAIML